MLPRQPLVFPSDPVPRRRLLPARWQPALALAGALLAACEDPDAGSGGDAPDVKPAPIVRLVVDTNRDGTLDLLTGTDDEGRDSFGATRGAAFLANLDDDDADEQADADTDGVDGDADVLDLAPIAVLAWPAVPEGATAEVSADPVSAPRVRLFRLAGPADQAASYLPAEDAGHVALTAADVAAGSLLAIEARTPRLTTAAADWDGRVRLTFTVTDATGTVLGTDHALLRVAPVLFQFNTAPTEHVYYSDSSGEAASLAAGIVPVCTSAVAKEAIKQRARDYDPWTQDFFDLAYMSRPGPGGKPHGMKVAVRSAQPDRTSGAVVDTKFRGPDVASIFVHDAGGVNPDSHGYSMSSFGNWDVVPPYTFGALAYPLGRNLWGQAGTRDEQPDATFVDFVRAQAVQPPINVDTSWLAVGHVDEYLSWVRTNTPRGWGALIARPSLARDMLLGLQASGHGATKLFVGKRVYDLESNNPRELSAARSIDRILADADLMAESQEAQVESDLAQQILQDEIGLTDDEFTPMPFLVERVFGAGLAYQPGTVNLLHVDGRVGVPKPFGPDIDGADPFETDLETRLGALGLSVYFVDDWNTYHRNMGEVHCGTNVARTLDLPWWESGR